MQVKDLLAMLQGLDPEAPLTGITYDRNDGFPSPGDDRHDDMDEPNEDGEWITPLAHTDLVDVVVMRKTGCVILRHISR